MKHIIRRKILSERNSRPERELLEKSERIKDNFFRLKEFREAGTVMFYVSKSREVATEDAIRRSLRMGKRVLVPFTDIENHKIIPCELKDFERELDIGAFGIKEPKKSFRRFVRPEDIDLVVVPGIAFDRRGYRIGYGKGFYDRFLGEAKNAEIVALAYDFQIVSRIPEEEHDVAVGKIVTEDGVVVCEKG
jgi:5-formyltetrahydrofolate cyclo-ligase